MLDSVPTLISNNQSPSPQPYHGNWGLHPVLRHLVITSLHSTINTSITQTLLGASLIIIAYLAHIANVTRLSIITLCQRLDWIPRMFRFHIWVLWDLSSTCVLHQLCSLSLYFGISQGSGSSDLDVSRKCNLSWFQNWGLAYMNGGHIYWVGDWGQGWITKNNTRLEANSE